MPGITARVVKMDGSLGKEGEQGELVVKGPSNALGYMGNIEAYVPKYVYILSLNFRIQHTRDVC
jgi:acyl-coenzyme A synthetase/AMP-(fatty) acid ligase